MRYESELTALGRRCLEAARIEACRRLSDAGLATVVCEDALVVEDREGGGWGAHSVSIPHSAFRSRESLAVLRDDSVPGQLFGLREQLAPLAERVDALSGLGQPRRLGINPAASGPDAVLSRVVVPLAHHYLDSIEDLAEPQSELLDHLIEEMVALVSAEEAVGVTELVLGGIQLEREFGPSRGVTLRPLTGLERGAIHAAANPWLLDFRTPEPGFFVPRSHSWFRPTLLLTTETLRPADEPSDESDLARRFVLALILLDFDLETSGVLVKYDWPRWSRSGYHSQPFPLASNSPVAPRGVSQDELTNAVEIAHRLPALADGLPGRESVVLDRILNGASRQPGAFLDNTIALEASLLPGIKSELRYRFSLYGALFLGEEHDPEITFAQLKEIYDIRSTIAHGGAERPGKEAQAAANAATLARAVVRKAVLKGWPVPSELDAKALGGAE
jgi:hypothetical protein